MGKYSQQPKRQYLGVDWGSIDDKDVAIEERSSIKYIDTYKMDKFI